MDRTSPRDPAEPPAEVAVVVPSWNTADLLADCLTSVARSRGGLPLEVVVVDNGSVDETAARVGAQFPSVRLIVNGENRGFAGAINQGVAATTAPWVLFLNSDARLGPDTLATMLRLGAAWPRAAVVGAQLRNLDGSFQASHAPFPTLGRELLILTGVGRLLFGHHYPSRGPGEAAGARRVDWVPGACMLVRRAALAQVGGLDEGYFMYAEEMDLCWRLRRAGWEVWYEPAAAAVHVGGGSTRADRSAFEAELYRSRVRFFRLHHGAGAARLLWLEIVALTAAKRLFHGVLRRVTRERRGRPVVSLRTLAARMKG